MTKTPLLCLHCWCGKKVWNARNKPTDENYKRWNGRLFHGNCYKIFRKMVNSINNYLRAMRYYQKNKNMILEIQKKTNPKKRKTKKFAYFKDLLIQIFKKIPVVMLAIQYRNMRIRSEPKKIEVLVCVTQ